MKTTFNAGDKVRVTSRDESVPYGTVLTVSDGPYGDCGGGNYYFEERLTIILGGNLELAEKKRKKSERIDVLESEVARLKSEVEALKQAKNTTINAPSVDEMMRLGKSVTLTPNERRADVIKRAKTFAERLTERGNVGTRFIEDGNGTYNKRLYLVEYHVNMEKRTVIALAKGKSGIVYERGSAKCDPADVFNADIGKAIALGRALGLDVTEFEQAVQPTEVVVGQIVTPSEDSCYEGGAFKVVNVAEGDVYDKPGSGWVDVESAVILEDTDAEYSR